MNITFSIPAYNDSKTIKNLVDECIAYARQNDFNFKFLLIDDGSKDETKSILQNLEAEHDFISAIYHPENLSFGPTLKEIFTIPQTEWICFLPGDHQFSAHEFLNSAINYVHEYDFILGKRVVRADNFHRLAISKFYNFCISLISSSKVSDVNSSALFKREVVEHANLNGTSAFIHAELYLNTLRQGFKIIEVPINHKKREFGKAGGSKLNVLLATFLDMVKYALSKKKEIT